MCGCAVCTVCVYVYSVHVQCVWLRCMYSVRVRVHCLCTVCLAALYVQCACTCTVCMYSVSGCAVCTVCVYFYSVYVQWSGCAACTVCMYMYRVHVQWSGCAVCTVCMYVYSVHVQCVWLRCMYSVCSRAWPVCMSVFVRGRDCRGCVCRIYSPYTHTPKHTHTPNQGVCAGYGGMGRNQKANQRGAGP